MGGHLIRRVAHATKGDIKRVLAERLSRIAERSKGQPLSAGHGAELLQEGQNLMRKRNDMFLAHLRPGGRDAPCRGVQIRTRTICEAKLAWAREGVSHHGERQPGDTLARIDLDGRMTRPAPSASMIAGMVRDLGRRERAAQVRRHVPPRPACGHSIAEDTAGEGKRVDRRLIPPGGFNLAERLQKFEASISATGRALIFPSSDAYQRSFTAVAAASPSRSRLAITSSATKAKVVAAAGLSLGGRPPLLKRRVLTLTNLPPSSVALLTGFRQGDFGVWPETEQTLDTPKRNFIRQSFDPPAVTWRKGHANPPACSPSLGP